MLIIEFLYFWSLLVIRIFITIINALFNSAVKFLSLFAQQLSNNQLEQRRAQAQIKWKGSVREDIRRKTWVKVVATPWWKQPEESCFNMFILHSFRLRNLKLLIKMFTKIFWYLMDIDGRSLQCRSFPTQQYLQDGEFL